MPLYCHDCNVSINIEQATLDLFYEHVHHVTEVYRSSDKPTFDPPNRVIACYNIYDCLTSLKISLSSIAPYVDAVIFVYGPYKLVFDPTGIMTEEEADEEERSHLDLALEFFDKSEIMWISRYVWENEIEKRTMYLKAPGLKEGDYLFIIDDDELFLSVSPATLRATLSFANRKTIAIGRRRSNKKSIGLDIENPTRFSVPLYHRGFRRPTDAIAMMRIFRWSPNYKYSINHSTIVDVTKTDEKKLAAVFVPEVMLWNISLIHVEDLKDPERLRRKREYYLMRNEFQLEGKREPHQNPET